MPTPKEGYFLKDGSRVPGVTTVLGRFKESGGLMYWAWEQGKAGLDFRETRQAAADAGTLAHAMVEAEIHGKPFTVPEGTAQETRDKACQAYRLYKEWAVQTRLVAVKTEVRLVSEQYRYGGTLDVILVGGRRVLGDWKTSNGVYGDYLCQLAAYGYLWNEANPDEPVAGYQLMRFSKDHPDFEARFFEELEEAWEMFLALRRAYELDKAVKARIGK